MPHHPPASRLRRRRLRAAGLLVVTVAAVAVLGSHGSAPSFSAITVPATPTTAPDVGSDGLDPALQNALDRAVQDAGAAGLVLGVTSGRRSPEHQERLFREAVATHGSEEQAARWVARPEASAHVSGDAIDVGPRAAAGWLEAHGAAYGLCRIYDNEPWHFELRPYATTQGCPPRYADPTHDPRLQP